MSKPTRWLYGEIESWVQGGVISRDQAARLRELYPAPAVALPWGMIIFSGLGAGLVGLGIILLFAYNWQAIPKFGKLALVFGSLVGAHAGGLALMEKPDWRRQLGEVLAVLGTMLFGAGIWLVAQVYNIDEHFPNGFLIWGAGALAQGWALRSIPQGVVAAAVLCVWSCSEVSGFSQPVAWAPLLLLAGVGGLAWRLRSRLLLGLTLLGLYVMLLVNAVSAAEQLAIPAMLGLGTALVAAALWAKHSRPWPAASLLLTLFGYGGFLATVYLLTFAHNADDLLHWTRHSTSPANLVCYGWVPFALALLAWVAWLARWGMQAAAERAPMQPEWCLLPGTLLAAQVFGFTETVRVAYPAAASAVFNLVLLALAGVWMARGCREGRLPATFTGSVVLVLLAIGRYFDLFDSLLGRGAVFLVVGGILFAEGFFYRRARRQQTESEAQP